MLWKVTVTPAWMYGNTAIVEADTKEEAKKIAYEKHQWKDGTYMWEGKKMKATPYKEPYDWRIGASMYD